MSDYLAYLYLGLRYLRIWMPVALQLRELLSQRPVGKLTEEQKQQLHDALDKALRDTGLLIGSGRTLS